MGESGATPPDFRKGGTMRYPLSLDGFTGTSVEVEPSGFFKGPRLFVGGELAARGKARGEFLLAPSTGEQRVLQLKRVFLDPIPVVHYQGQTIRIAPALTWYEWAWAAWTLFLLFAGGALGGFLAAVAAVLNIRILRSKAPAIVRYVATFLVSAIAVTLFVVIARTIQAAIGRHE